MTDLFDGSPNELGYVPTGVQVLANHIAIGLSFRYPLQGVEREAWKRVREIADIFDVLRAEGDPEATVARMRGGIERAFQELTLARPRGQNIEPDGT
ncbi:MAG: hypothetical protein ACREMT_06205 [Vulcanimicrobiaceae bacterium]